MSSGNMKNFSNSNEKCLYKSIPCLRLDHYLYNIGCHKALSQMASKMYKIETSIRPQVPKGRALHVNPGFLRITATILKKRGSL